MARSKISIATRNLKVKLLGHAAEAVVGVQALELNGELDAAQCTHLENSCLDLIGAIREYQRSFKPLFTQGQKS